MPVLDPASIDLRALFRDADMFDSRRAWSEAGFRVIDRSNDGKVMVGRHPAVPGLLFKKYTNDVSEKDQSRNYERRVEGSRRLREFVSDRRLRHIVVPHKWILGLPRPFKGHVLVAEQLDLLDDGATKSAYRQIEPDVLKDLCVLLFHFRGMDSIAKNLPFTTDGRIGLVDTEHWDRSTSKPYLHRVGDHLSKERRALAKAILSRLDDGGDADLRGLDVGDFDEEDSVSDSDSDFTREEDTSASSSSSS